MKKRKPIVAFVLSWLSPGVGQLYNGQARNAVALYVSMLLFVTLLSLGILLLKGLGLVLALTGIFSFQLIVAVLAFKAAKSIGGVDPEWYNKWYIYAAIIAATSLLPDYVGIFAKPYTVPSGAMLPTVVPGDRIIANTVAYGIPLPFTDTRLFAPEAERGDIVIFPSPNEPSVDYIMRVIAVGGESVSVRDNTVYINGKPLSESYAYFDPAVLSVISGKAAGRPNVFGPVTVPQGKLFVMGDNRFNSPDSRIWGFVDTLSVKGKASFVYWSSNPRQDNWFDARRSDRIGLSLK